MLVVDLTGVQRELDGLVFSWCEGLHSLSSLLKAVLAVPAPISRRCVVVGELNPCCFECLLDGLHRAGIGRDLPCGLLEALQRGESGSLGGGSASSI